MATTTNFGWETPDDTDLVKDGALAMRTLGNAIDTSLVDLKGGTTGQVLSKTSNTDMDFTWVTSDDANAIQNAIVDAKGDLITATAADTPARLAVGSNGDTLVADSAAATGLKWQAQTVNTVIDAKGDLLAGTAADTVARLAVGTNGQVLTADSTTATGLKWAAAAGGGKVLQVVQATATNTTTNSTSTYADATGLAVTITPSATSSKVLVVFVHQIYISGGDTTSCLNLRILRGASAIHTYGTELGRIIGAASSKQLQATAVYLDSPSTTSATTYKVQFNNNANVSNVAINDPASTMVAIAMEIGA